MTGESQLELQDITHRYGQVAALEDVSLTIADGEFVDAPRPLRLREDDAPPHRRRVRPTERGPTPTAGT